MQNFHERFDREEAIAISSDRSFCIVFAVFFAALGAYKLYHGNPLGNCWLGCAFFALAIALFKPALAAPLNRAWAHLGTQLAKIMNPFVLGLLYYSTIVPMGLFARITGKNLLQLKYDHEAESYWIIRTPPGPAPETMTNQF